MSALGGETAQPEQPYSMDERRYAAFFHELDAWTEYWDVYHPETHGRFYFGDGSNEPGLLTRLLPRDGPPGVFKAWTRAALGVAPPSDFSEAARAPEVASAVAEIDALLGRIFSAHFGDAADPAVRADYLEAIFRFATNTLPPATERDAKIPADDPRKPTAGRHRLEGDLMWFAWALVLEAAALTCAGDGQQARRNLMLAGVATGCPADYAWRGHRRTRSEYAPDDATAEILRERGMRWAAAPDDCAREIDALYRIREWGPDS